MLAMRIIPCLDVKDGRVVKGVNFVGLRDAGDPVEVAQRYDEEGADELTFLDITASHERRNIILDVVARTAETVFMPLTVGGGVRELADVRALLNAGADKVSINTAAVHNPDLALTRAVADAVTIPVIASGGVGTLEHIYEGLTAGGATAALAASIFHYQEYTVHQCKAYLAARGVVVRV